MPKYRNDQRVQIHNPANYQHDRIGIVIGYENASNSYLVDLDGQFVIVAEECLQDASFDWGQK